MSLMMIDSMLADLGLMIDESNLDEQLNRLVMESMQDDSV